MSGNAYKVSGNAHKVSGNAYKPIKTHISIPIIIPSGVKNPIIIPPGVKTHIIYIGLLNYVHHQYL